jgi:hypothetical protein
MDKLPPLITHPLTANPHVLRHPESPTPHPHSREKADPS